MRKTERILRSFDGSWRGGLLEPCRNAGHIWRMTRDPNTPETRFDAVAKCTYCADWFQKTHTGHPPRSVLWAEPGARILIAGQAPGARVHASGRPFTDPSGDRLRGWMDVDDATFYDRSKISIVPMAFCFPGYNEKGHDLPPPKECAKLWRAGILEALGPFDLTLLVGGYAQDWHIGKGTVTARVGAWRDHAPHVFPLPHPSWRTTGWVKKNPWFGGELIPELRMRIKEVLDD